MTDSALSAAAKQRRDSLTTDELRQWQQEQLAALHSKWQALGDVEHQCPQTAETFSYLYSGNQQ